MKTNIGKFGVSPRLAILLACAACVLAVRGEDRKERVLRRLEAVKVENVRLAWADMVRRWPDRFEASPEWLRTFEARRQKLLSSIKGDWGPY